MHGSLLISSVDVRWIIYRKEYESTITELKSRLEKNESDFRELKQKDDEKDKGSMQEKQKLQQQLNEKTNMLKEYQTKVSTHKWNYVWIDRLVHYMHVQL